MSHLLVKNGAAGTRLTIDQGIAHARSFGGLLATFLLSVTLLSVGCYCLVEPPSTETRQLITLGSATTFTPAQVKQLHDDFARRQLDDLAAAAAQDPLDSTTGSNNSRPA